MSQFEERLMQSLHYFKVPESEYSFFGEQRDACLGVEKKESVWEEYDRLTGKKKEHVWEVYECHNGEKKIRGIFFYEYDAYDFLFYLLMKKHVNIKKRWW